MKVRVKIENKIGKNFVVKEIERIVQISELDCELLAKKCEEVISNIIAVKSKRSTGYLASFFNAEKIPGGWGNGNIEELDRVCEYWVHLEVGSEGIGADRSHWLPKGKWVDGRWIEDDAGYWVKHTGPIPAMCYIAETISTMDSLISQILGRK